MKKLLSAYVISFVLSFMLYIFEPITMYLTNVNDFWFDLTVIIKPLLIYALCLFIGISVLFTIIFFLNKLFKKSKIYEVCTLMLFICFICTYIQGNYLAGKLPSLDGTVIDWSQYTTLSVISIALWIVSIAVIVFTSIKFKIENVVKTSMYISLAVFAMLSVSLVTTFMQSDTKAKETPIAITMNNYNHASKNKNLYVIVLDATDSVTFERVLESDPDFKDTFNDFTYYKDTLSAYPFTRDSIPFMLTGEWNENVDDFRTYSTKALNNSKFLNTLENEGYERNLYEEELVWDDEKVTNIDNINALDKKIKIVEYFKNQTKYILFKYLPYPLKKYSRIESMNYTNCKVVEDIFKSDNDYNYDYIKNMNMEIINKNVFNFYHYQGAHVPCHYNKQVVNTGVESYDDTVLGTLTMVDTFINKLKEADVYDNSAIIVMADHGYGFGRVFYGRQNPILFVKGLNEHHSKLKKSDLPISFADLMTGYNNLLDGKQGESVFGNIDKNRERRYMWYKYTEEDHMVEYFTKSKAWETDKMYKSGKEFDR